ncbi:N-acetylserotonin o-methyltransferase-like protein [Plakobranchus ocellatus]|uniref:N-acetylserotonin o-methyltransferase-like protein n=1 Tax=Plakobranchus ocellatus TaxID=259542 RepID=A0AAV3ZH44_9GAST|nr:N-acetylserotonin o-methyltransferase-like protein [Plakobranchus ocellatus]
MLQPILQTLNAQRVVLASGSPRRKQILENIGLKVEVIPSTFEENLDKSKFSPQEYVVETAFLKTKEVAERLSAGSTLPDLIIGADTVVSKGNEIIEKPVDKDHAFQILSQLSNCSHTVYTGLVLFVPSHSPVMSQGSPTLEGTYRSTSFVDSTSVHMADLSEKVIKAYIETGESMDKAGAYGIQGVGGTLVEKINGDYFNVMGFPLPKFAKEIASLYADFKKESEKKGLELNRKKTEVMVVSRKQELPIINIYIKGKRLKQKDQFKYLGSLISSDGRNNSEVASRIAQAKTNFQKMKTVLTNKNIHPDKKKSP